MGWRLTVCTFAAFAAITATITAAPKAHAAQNVVASIKPVHSLVAAVMRGVGEPRLILRGASSPHIASLAPSQATMIEEADLIFWIGPDLETFLEKSLETIAADAQSVALIETPGLTRLGFREGGAFEAHDHGSADEHGHDEDGHEEHGHEEDGHEHASHDEDGHEHASHDEDDHAGQDGDPASHEHGAFDPHVWLDPLNAKHMVEYIASTLAEHDPANAATYRSNGENLARELDALTAEISDMMAPLHDKRFVVFHDAYHYFEARFGISASAAITVSPDVMPGADRIREIRTHVREADAVCVFAEPQFPPKLVSVVVEGTSTRSAVIDPLGAGLDDGPGLYAELLREMARSFRDCLGGNG